MTETGTITDVKVETKSENMPTMALKKKEETPLVLQDFNYARKLAELTPEEKKELQALTVKLDPTDMSTVRVYGSELSGVISSNGSELLNSVRADKTNEVVALSTDLLKQLNMLDLDKINDYGLWSRICARIPILKKLTRRIENTFAEYDTIKGNVDKISKKISASKMIAMADNSSLQKIFENNVKYIDKMRDLILGAKLYINDLKVQTETMKKDQNVEMWQIKDMNDYTNMLEKRVADMQTEAYIMTQNLYQIRAIQSNNMNIAEKADNIVTNIIPVWSTQLAMAVTMKHQQESVEAQMKISETTNTMLRKNAENLKINSINVAKESERAIVDVETLRQTTQALMDTIREVQQIHESGRQQRAQLESDIQNCAEELHQLLLSE